MLLLHISDIHFRHPHCAGPMDPDLSYRTALVSDVSRRTLQAGDNVDAIIVTGDIAFAAIRAEFDYANTWLIQLAARCGCSPEKIFLVPGNHDLNRDVTKDNLAVSNAQTAIAVSKHPEKTLRDQFLYIETGRSLLEPLAEYNLFAAKFGCQLFAPKQLFWMQELALNDGVTLRLYGLTSTILSGRHGGNDTKGQLYLSPLQTVLNPDDDVVSAVLCHHPPDWLQDVDAVEDAVSARAELHFFGHKHRNRYVFTDTYARFNAGAVSPDRNEPGWEPGYNLVRLTVLRGNGRKNLDVEARMLSWQTNPDLFKPKQNLEGQSVFRKHLPIRGSLKENSSPEVSESGETAPRGTESMATPTSQTPSVKGPGQEESMRDLVYRFWALTTSQRREIALGLALIDEQDLDLDEPERYGRALIRARELEKLDSLAMEIQAREGR
jgi:predicted phosphodiesterase